MSALQAALPVRGSIRLVLLRVAVLLLALLPVIPGLGFAGQPRRPWLHADGSGMEHTVIWLQHGLTDQGGLLVGCLLAAVLLDLVVTAGAIRWLDPAADHGRWQLVGPAVIGEGTVHLWPMLRVVAGAAVIGGLGVAVVAGTVGAIAEGMADPNRLAATGATLSALWLLCVGGVSHVVQVVTVGEGHRVVWRAALRGLKLAFRRPLHGPIPHVVLGLLLAPLPGLVLAGWRAADPRALWTGWALAFVGTLLLQALAWHLLIRLTHRARVASAQSEPAAPQST